MSIDAQVEKEIVIDLQEEVPEEKVSETNSEINHENTSINETKEEESVEKNTNKFIEKKPITKLTEDERAFIIANAKAGVDQPYFNVKFFKNGKAQIIKKKETPQTVAQKITAQKPPPQAKLESATDSVPRLSLMQPKKEQQVYYTDNQLLFEHIIELNAKVEKLMHKQKKLKRRYQTLQDDIYVDDSEETPQNIPQEKIPQISSPSSEPEVLPQAPHQNVNIKRLPMEDSRTASMRNVRSVKNGWRSQIAFL